jgi:hypothetical protein
MRNRLDENPVKIIQLLPVDNEPAKRPIRRLNPVRFFRRLRIACLRMVNRLTEGMRGLMERQRRFVTDVAGRIDALTSGTRPNKRLGPPPGSPCAKKPGETDGQPTSVHGRAVEPDAVAFAPSEQAAEEGLPSPASPCPPARLDRLDAAKAAVSSGLSYRLDRFNAAKASTVAALRSWKNAAVQKMVGTRVRLADHTGRAVRTIDSNLRSFCTPPWTRHMRKELDVTRAALLAQQQALENTTTQVHAMQKELAAQKHVLTDLVKQIQGLEAKIAQLAQPPTPQKPRESSEPASPRRVLAKKSAAAERSREHRL